MSSYNPRARLPKSFVPYQGVIPPWEEASTIDVENNGQQQRLAMILEQLGETAGAFEDCELEDIEPEPVQPTIYNFRQAAGVLGITYREMQRLCRHPLLRKARGRFDQQVLDEMKSRLAYCRARKWRVPECLMPWE